MIRQALVPIIVVFLPAFSSVQAGEAIDFSRDIRPILSNNCFHCHGPDKNTREAGLRLDTPEGMFEDRGDYAAFVPGKPDESEAMRRVLSDESSVQMPPKHSKLSLTSEQKELLRLWVEQGAEWEQHWAFVPPQRPELPAVTNGAWPHNAIDHFVLDRLEQEGLEPSPEAQKERLIRRVTLDLTGLPPTLDEVDAFLADESPGAYERLVDRLLQSPRYGERMVWEWLDAARYADTNGFQGDPTRTMWPWKDWVVRALNDNMPFDQFTIEQLAGDLLPDATTQQIIATGFNRNHMHNGEGGRIAEETRVENVMDRAETTSTVWLGLTMTCARCHDHKYDPISQQEYYQLYAFFNNTSETGAGRSGQNPPVIDYLTPEDETRRAGLNRMVRQSADKVEARERELFPRDEDQPAARSPEAAELPQEIIDHLDRSPERRGSQALDEMIEHFADEWPGYAKRLTELKQAVIRRERFVRQIPRVMVMDEEHLRETALLELGAYDKPTGDPLNPDVPAVFPALSDEAPADRLALARWLVDDEHPLTARVAVNRYWQTFFGTGLVKTVEDFGIQADRPSHPELLDWLATEFVRSGWDVKHMHRLMVTSAAYRQSSRIPPSLLERDPDNRLLARGPRFRLPAWMLRDQALAAGGLLVEQVGGPPVKPYQPEGIWAEATFGKTQYVQDHGEKLYRRSVYIFWRRIVGPTMFFDTAKRQTCTVTKTRTNTPLHALVLLNDVTYVEAARALAEQALTTADRTPESCIEDLFRRVTSRFPEPAELDILCNRLERLTEEFTQDRPAALALLQVGESSRNENLSTVEHAAYTALCTLILNLDETLTKQ